ncbi:hypothetical protein KZZ52_19805 [Dactylosporangium sp. AC04546]|uniref:hypothetical protein n=1 Tax=Dactylosporangium sp. AC04546 TaxID=2862460 RepID=UPI001EDD2EBC|nr:hypothetical protein [Dactylosporangium sp. AC04546]WVK87543.1 hypothetical protein KZZ52_19805 [Dactylosporangium sp. AC04546]
MRHRRSSNALALALLLVCFTVTTLAVVALVIWARGHDGPWFVLLWLAVKTLVTGKLAVKFAAAAGLAAAVLWRVATDRVRARRAAAARAGAAPADPPAEPARR